MWIRVLQDTLIAGQWTGVGVGNFEPAVADHLISIGVAEPYETKVSAPVEAKEKKTLSSASQQGQASQKPTAKKRRGRPPKSSQ